MIEVRDLTVDYVTEESRVRACEGISFEVAEGEVLGIMGESGCGKSTVGQAMLRLLPTNADVVSGEVRYKGQDLLDMSPDQLRALRWEEIAIVTQGSMDAFDPVYTIREQISESIRTHREVSKTDARDRVDELFDLVSISPDRADDYPHQLSGGMKQRALIAMALALDPSFLVVDEPTTGLDVITQDSILAELEALQNEFGTSVLFITHDMGVISETSDRVLVMYAGEIVESANTAALFEEPYHPYTLGLVNSVPDIRQHREQDLVSIPGMPPTVFGEMEQCRFVDRCPFSEPQCHTEAPELEEVGDGHKSRCLRHDVHAEMIERSGERETWLSENQPEPEMKER